MDQIQFLNLTTQPAIWDAEQTGWFLNMSREDVLLLCRRKHLPALADPPPGAQRYFWGKHVRSLAEDEKWLKKAILILRKNVTENNAAAKHDQLLRLRGRLRRPSRRAPPSGRAQSG